VASQDCRWTGSIERPGDPHLPPGLARIVERCLEKDPAARFQSAHDLAFALEAYAATNASGTPLIWVRALDAVEAQPLPGTEGARQPFWSPNGRFIAFFALGTLRKVPIGGGPAQVICEAVNVPTGGSWGREGVILFSGLAGPLQRVPAGGGTPAPATEMSKEHRDERHSFPNFLPDGRRFLFSIRSPDPRRDGIYVQALDSREARLVVRAASNMSYADSGHLLSVRDGALLGQRFDPDRAVVEGDPVPLAERVDYFSESGAASFSARGGVLGFRGSGESGSEAAPGRRRARHHDAREGLARRAVGGLRRHRFGALRGLGCQDSKWC
jgi:hypothetical protein